MKYFVIDQGNTLTKLAVFEEDSIVDIIRFENSSSINGIIDYLRLHNIKSGIVSSVRTPGLTIESDDIQAVVFSQNTKLFFTSDYDSPQTLGLDRIANVAGAIKMQKSKSFLIVDFGTCTTYSLVTEGVFRGGAISPGLDMRFKALNAFTSGLPLVKKSNELSAEVLGKTTEGSIRAGVEAAGLLEVDSMIQQFCSLYEDLNVIGTGGNLAFFESHLKSTIFAAPNLTLLGLYEIYKYNEF